MLWKLTQRAFNGGQLDRRLMGRTDLAKYYQGASELENFIVLRQGCISRRPGTEVVYALPELDGGAALVSCRLIPFNDELDSGFAIVLYAVRPSGATAAVTHCRIVDTFGRGTAASLDVPYAADDLAELDYCQSGDTVFIAHRRYPFAKIVRKDDGTWIYRAINFKTLDYASLPAAPTIELIDGQSTVSSDDGQKVKLEYCVTAVAANGSESVVSNIYPKTYKSPWKEGGKFTIHVEDIPDEAMKLFFYKRSGGRGWGFIGATELAPPKKYGETESYSSSGGGGRLTGAGSLWHVLLNHDTGYSDHTGATDYKRNPFRLKDVPLYDSDWYDIEETGNKGVAGFIYKSGTFKVDFPDGGKSFTAISLGLGFAFVSDGVDNRNPDEMRYVGQFWPCKASKIRADFELDDGSRITLVESVPDAVKNDQIKITVTKTNMEPTHEDKESAWGDVVSGLQGKNTPNVWMKFSLFEEGDADEGRKVLSVTFTAFADEDCTVVAATDDFPEIPNLWHWAPVESFPESLFVIRGYNIQTRNIVHRATTATFEDDYILPEQSVTPPKYENHFESPGKYPGCVTLYQQRLVLASTDLQPFTFWMSCVGDLYNFNTHDALREDDALEVTLPALKYPNINHMVVNRDLILLCDNGEWIVSPVAGNAMSYATVSTKLESQIGGSVMHQPVVVGNDVLFVNAADETVVATRYDFTSDSYGTQDLSVLSHDIFRENPITSIAYWKNPDSIIVVTLRDGSFATLTYMKEHGVVAWSTHRLAGGVAALAVAADGSMSGGSSHVYLLASDGSLLTFCKQAAADGDALVARPMPARLDFIRPLADGEAVPEGEVGLALESGSWRAVAPGGEAALAGRPFESRLVTVRPEPSPNETVQFEIKNPTHVDLRLLEATDVRVGQLGMPRAQDRAVSAGPYAEKDVSVNVAGANGRDGRIRLACSTAYPLTLLSLYATYQVEMADQNPGGKG